MGAKNDFLKTAFGGSALQGSQMVEFKGQIPNFLHIYVIQSNLDNRTNSVIEKSI